MRNFYLIGICCLAMSGCGRNEPVASTENDGRGLAQKTTEVIEGVAEGDTSAAGNGNAAAPAGSMSSSSDAPVSAATAQLQPTQGNTASGTLQLAARKGVLHVAGQVSGLEPNSVHGIHIHENGDCSAADGKSAGEHFAPLQHLHGAPGLNTHVGDLGNIHANGQGVAEVNVNAVLATLGTGAATDVKGKAIIVHAKQDDLESQPSGNSGARIACGVIS